MLHNLTGKRLHVDCDEVDISFPTKIFNLRWEQGPLGSSPATPKYTTAICMTGQSDYLVITFGVTGQSDVGTDTYIGYIEDPLALLPSGAQDCSSDVVVSDNGTRKNGVLTIIDVSPTSHRMELLNLGGNYGPGNDNGLLCQTFMFYRGPLIKDYLPT